MKDAIVTITGTRHYYGLRPLREGALVLLVKEPDNARDGEAIRAEIAPVGKVGYVANSPYTVVRGTLSAGRVYDRMERACFARVVAVGDGCAIARLEPQIRESVIVMSLDEEEPRHAAPGFSRIGDG